MKPSRCFIHLLRTLKRVFHPSPADTEQKGWLKVAESAFAFWDNPDDDGWDQL